ncbi:cupin-like domain-containing protein [Endozoicomonas sp. SM1973]|uniref:Cupin-like domain-containing protein n=1 Tax=Spartinivicinus marinus TaxID=2994442 RepID=A0A853IDF2_9GAMM|nr:cupin-like domain-containing protein [Spartinivicinus marinus]MCX4028548.1 cupin-like domain-containing protein [Spartinivicinus marinus]NYZ67215.1 cupin-like domain-containing protein [Spartinivicinus marinus]
MKLTKIPIAVDEVNDILPAEFKSCYVDRHRPLIIRGGVKHWSAMQWSSDEYLLKIAGDQRVKVDVFPLSEQGEILLESGNEAVMSIKDFTIKFFQETHGYYILDQNLPPPLYQDLNEHCVSSVFPVERRRTFWWGKSGQRSFLHYDDNENLMCQFDGEKEFLLFDITDFNYLYPKDTIDYRSLVNLEQYELSQFPYLAKATPYVARIRAGDILYVPCYWWHQVKSYGRNIAVSYIINESMEQRVRVTGRLIEAGILPVSDSIRDDLLNIIALDETPSRRNALLKKYHREYQQQQGKSYYPHSLFHRLIEENLFDILYGHATY